MPDLRHDDSGDEQGEPQLLRGLRRMLKDQGRRNSLKGAVATLVQTAGTVRGSLQSGNRNGALTAAPAS